MTGQQVSYEFIYREETDTQQPSNIRVFREPHSQSHQLHLQEELCIIDTSAALD